MKQLIVLFYFISILSFSQSTVDFDKYPTYNGNDLGVSFKYNSICIKVWSPAAQKMILKIYDQGCDGKLLETKVMKYNTNNGVWSAELSINNENKYYTLQAEIDGKTMNEVADPYAKSTGVNGKRGMILDLSKLKNQNKFKYPWSSKNEIILYEVHIRDLSTHSTAHINNRGKFLGFTEYKTKNNNRLSTGLDHISELGITHLHLLPVFDFMSIDESKFQENKFNWGYDPMNYNTPEGSYSTNPFAGEVRINEFNKMVQSIHNKGIAVVMDVVYNHTGEAETSNFNQLVPQYYYRQNKGGEFSNASGCGNETASERYMVRKFILESLIHWMTFYGIDGFRFDLMAIHDIETMNYISDSLHKLNPNVFLYGEGWTAGDSPLPYEKRALKQHGKSLNKIAVFSDDLRDGIKGHWSNVHEKGFVSGNKDLKEVVKFGIVASTNHPQIQYDINRNYAQFPYANVPSGVIGYVACHDNNTLYDK